MTTCTEKEQAALDFIYAEGVRCNGATSKEGMRQDNMTWFRARDLMTGLGLSRQEAAGIMSALDAKGLAYDTEDGHGDGSRADWVLTNKGIELAALPSAKAEG